MKFLFNNKDELLDTLPDPILAMNYERKLLFCNKAAENLLGYTSREIKDMAVTQIFAQGAEVFYNSMIHNKRNSINAKTKTGLDLVLEVTAYDVEESQHVMICARDITETHNIITSVIAEYKENQKKTEKRNAFISEMSNEFTKPMNSIIGFSQALLEGIGGELTEKQEKYLNIIAKNALALHNNLEAVIDITKLDGNKMPIEKRIFDVGNLINLVTQAFIPTFTQKEIDFKLKFAGLERRKVYTDENLLRRVLTILIDNAAKFTNSGTVEVSVSNPDLTYARLQGYFVPPKALPNSYLMIKITDSGIGIKEENLNLIFDEYSLIDKTRKVSGEKTGTGLNLAITKKIADALGGIIWVESAVDKGSAFTFIIPINREEEQDTQSNE